MAVNRVCPKCKQQFLDGELLVEVMKIGIRNGVRVVYANMEARYAHLVCPSSLVEDEPNKVTFIDPSTGETVFNMEVKANGERQ